MDHQTRNATCAGLLCDVESSFSPYASEASPIRDLEASLQADSRTKHIVGLARKMSISGNVVVSRRPLSPIFTHLNGNLCGMVIPPVPNDGQLRMPVPATDHSISPERYQSVWGQLSSELSDFSVSAFELNHLTYVLEKWCSTLPSAVGEADDSDISLFDQSRMTAAFAACISEYARSMIQESKEFLQSESANLFQEKMFLLYSADFSGIQHFLYTVSTKNALRSLRSRSFFLELLLEHFVDELLEGCGVSRVNLLYSGGGHCYVLLPNTERAAEVCSAWGQRFNDWLTSQFGSLLYLADGWTACSANELNNIPAENSPYKAIFQRVSSAISAKKLRRYSGRQLAAMNTMEANHSGQECRVCGRTYQLHGDVCQWCGLFEHLSYSIQNKEVFLSGEHPTLPPEFVLPTRTGYTSFYFVRSDGASSMSDAGFQIHRIYAKASALFAPADAIRLHVGDYTAGNQLTDLADSAEGIRRIAVCRMDVDDLGQAFVSGFEDPGGSSPERTMRYVNITRTSAFSRQVSLFFKCYINELLSGRYRDRRPLNVSIVYSGGDDVFLVGSWSDTINAAIRIQDALSEFSCRSLTTSAGIGIFPTRFPIRIAADQTAELEALAKELPGKNAVSLFDTEGFHTYGWTTFQNRVLQEKHSTLSDFFALRDDLDPAFLYRLLELLDGARDRTEGRLNLARYAYVLSMLEPSRGDPGWESYRIFADRMYGWALSTEDRRELVTAIYIYIYRTRKKR